MLNQQTLQQVRDFAISSDWNTAFAGTSHGNQHLFRMVKIATWLADRLQADKNIVEAAAWLHDFPLASGHDYNYKRNQKVTKSILDNFTLTEEEENRITNAAAAHEGTGDIPTLEAQIIHDADVLEKTGILGIIRHTWKLIHSSEGSNQGDDTSIANSVVEHLQWRRQRLQTSLAKDIHHYLIKDLDMSPSFTQKIVSYIRPLAEQHMITEKIAQELKQILRDTEYQKLEEQLSLDYLRLFDKKN